MVKIQQDREWWEQQFRQGSWDFLKSLQEIPRYCVLCSYMKHLGRSISLLDVGCGEGLLLKFCEREWLVSYSGLDISQTALDKIKTLLPGDRLICSALEEFSTDEKFDVILFNEVLYYIHDPETHLNKFCNYLNPGGIFIISTYKKSGWFFHNNRRIRSAWHFISKCRWKKIDEVLIKNIPYRKSWKIALIQP